MRLVQQVQLDAGEQAELTEALVHIRIVFDGDEPEVRAIRHMATGQPTTREIVDRAERGLHALHLRCQAESQEAFWLANLSVAPARRKRLEQACMPLIADAAEFARTMVAVRERQARQALAAQRICATCRRVLPAPLPAGL